MPTRKPRPPRVGPCKAYNYGTCILENCPNSHFPDSFSLGSGGRNVCLLHLTNHCDGYGCDYSHCREDLEWTDEQVLQAIHEQMKGVHAFISRMQMPRFIAVPATVAPVAYPPFAVPWMPNTQQAPYPTPGHSATSASPVEDRPAQQKNVEDETAVCKPVSPLQEAEPAVGFQEPDQIDQIATSESFPETQEVEDQIEDSIVIAQEETQTSQLNPNAAAFVPINFIPRQNSSDKATLNPQEIENSDEPFEYPAFDDAASVQEEMTIVGATSEELKGWIPPTSALSWDDVQTGTAEATWDSPLPPSNNVLDNESTPAWKIDIPKGGWDAVPEDGWGTPPKSPVFSMDPIPETGPDIVWDQKVSEKKTDIGKHFDQTAQKGQKKKDTKKARGSLEKQPKEKPSKGQSSTAKKQEAKSLNKGKAAPPNSYMKKRASLVVVVDESTEASEIFWPEVPPHLSEGQEDAAPSTQKLPIQIGCIIPTQEKQKEIIQASLEMAQAAKKRAQEAAKAPEAVNDAGMEWVNHGTKWTDRNAPDSPRDFSQRSTGVSSSSWVGSKASKTSRWPMPGQ